MSRTTLDTGGGEGATVRRTGGVTDRTADTMQWLRARRGAGRARRFAYAAYVALFLLLGWYGLFVIGLFYEIGHRRPLADSADAIARMLPSGLVFAALAGFFLTLRDALWRGPVILPRPDVDWLLALPVRRGPVLLPWFVLSAGIWALAALSWARCSSRQPGSAGSAF
ncbi:hypothetical protein ACWD00_39005 [Streptomyces viridiviolaceus]